MYGSLDISTSALVANRIRADSIAANLAAADIPGSLTGGTPPPPVREAVFALGDPDHGQELGVHVAEIRLRHAYVPRYEPWRPEADVMGIVWYPDINPVEQQANLMLAVRSYEANIAAIEVRKSMIQSALEILA